MDDKKVNIKKSIKHQSSEAFQDCLWVFILLLTHFKLFASLISMSWEISIALGVLFAVIILLFLALFFIAPEWLGVSKASQIKANSAETYTSKKPNDENN